MIKEIIISAVSAITIGLAVIVAVAHFTENVTTDQVTLNSYKNKCFSNGGIEFRVQSVGSHECIYKNECNKGFCELKR